MFYVSRNNCYREIWFTVECVLSADEETKLFSLVNEEELCVQQWSARFPWRFSLSLEKSFSHSWWSLLVMMMSDRQWAKRAFYFFSMLPGYYASAFFFDVFSSTNNMLSRWNSIFLRLCGFSLVEFSSRALLYELLVHAEATPQYNNRRRVREVKRREEKKLTK